MFLFIKDCCSEFCDFYGNPFKLLISKYAMKKETRIISYFIIGFLVLSVFAIPLASANWWTDLWGKITGRTVGSTNPSAIPYGMNECVQTGTNVKYCQGSVQNVIDGDLNTHWYPANYKANVLVEYPQLISN